MYLPKGGQGQLREHLGEVKTVHYGGTHYGQAASGARCAAVERRAKGLQAERLRQFKATDTLVFGTAQGQEGPMAAKFAKYPSVVAVVTGTFHEWSQALVGLLQTFACMGAVVWRAKVGAPTLAAAKATLLRLMRAEVGTLVARGHARLVLRRMRALAAGQARRVPGAGLGAARGPLGASGESSSSSGHLVDSYAQRKALEREMSASAGRSEFSRGG